MKIVKLNGSIVQEVIPGYALPVEKFYGSAFAAQCVAAPDEVEQGWVHDPVTGLFSAPSTQATPKPDPIEVLKDENTLLKAQVQALSERNDFIEDCIAEMAGMVYG